MSNTRAVFFIILFCGYLFIACGPDSGPEEVILQNGVTVVLKNEPSTPIVSVLMRVKAGSINETEETQSISRLVEKAIFRQTAGCPDVQWSIESYGGTYFASTTRDYNSFFFEVTNDYLLDVLNIIADVVQYTQLNDSLITRVKSELKGTMAREQSFRTVLRKHFLENTFQKHPYRFLAQGNPDRLGALTAGQADTFFKSLYIPENINLAIVGGFNKKKLLDNLKKNIGAFERKPVKKFTWEEEPAQGAPREIVSAYSSNKPLALISVGWAAPSVRSSDTYPMDVLLVTLGVGESTRLNRQVRDRYKKVYFVETEYVTPMEPGYILITVLCDPSVVDAVKEQILNEVDIIRKDSITPNELMRAKRYFEAQEAYGHQSTRRAAFSYCFWSLMQDLRFARRYLPNIQRVSLADVKVTAEKYLKRSNYTSVILYPEKSE